jgi:hypothetical protein
LLNRIENVVVLVYIRFRRLLQGAAKFRKYDALAGSEKQRDFQFIFQLLDGFADPLLGDKAPSGSFGKIPFLANPQKIKQLTVFHTDILSQLIVVSIRKSFVLQKFQAIVIFYISTS